MKLVRLRVNNFRCFGSQTTEITFKNASYIIGPNGSGKTAILQALARMFSVDPSLRRVCASDFHIPAGESPDAAPPERKLWLEAEFEFPELAAVATNALQPSVPGAFAHLHMETDDEAALIRLRLQASLDQDGDIEETFTAINRVDASGAILSESKVSKLDRSSIQVHYLPARRNPADHVSYSANALLGRFLRAANWTTEREAISKLTSQITEALAGNAAVTELGAGVAGAWNKLHRGRYYANPSISFARSEVEALLRHMTLNFSPGPDAPLVDFSRLSDGQQSLLYISLVLSMREIGDKVLAGSNAFDIDKLRPPLFMLLAVEEPENSLSPHYLGRVIQALKVFGTGRDAQALVATHAPALLRRVDPEDIRYLRLGADRRTLVTHVTLPSGTDEAEKYVRQAVKAFPEIYFARLVILGEGDSEEIVLPRMLAASGMLTDDASVSIVPLGGRHVNHFWRLLRDLGIPHVTLLDLDLARHQGGWGRVRYAANQLLAFKVDASLTGAAVAAIPKWNATAPRLAEGDRWISYLEGQGVFFSAPLDLDMMMLECFPRAYDVDDILELADPDDAAVKSVLGKGHDQYEGQYSPATKRLFDAYHDRFKVGSKPSHHVKALASLSDQELLASAPLVLRRLIAAVEGKLEALPE